VDAFLGSVLFLYNFLKSSFVKTFLLYMAKLVAKEHLGRGLEIIGAE